MTDVSNKLPPWPVMTGDRSLYNREVVEEYDAELIAALRIRLTLALAMLTASVDDIALPASHPIMRDIRANIAACTEPT